MEQLALKLPFVDNVTYLDQYRDDPNLHPEMRTFLTREHDIEEIDEIAQWMHDNMPAAEFEPTHFFTEGQYARQLKLEAGQFVIGRRHRHGHITMLMQGDATIITDDGENSWVERVKGPRCWIDPPHIRRTLYIHSDCVFVTVHKTDSTDLPQLMDELTYPAPWEQPLQLEDAS